MATRVALSYICVRAEPRADLSALRTARPSDRPRSVVCAPGAHCLAGLLGHDLAGLLMLRVVGHPGDSATRTCYLSAVTDWEQNEYLELF